MCPLIPTIISAECAWRMASSTGMINVHIIIGDGDAEYSTLGSSDPCFNRCLANLALQHQLGILSQWRAGADPHYSAGVGIDGKINSW